MHAIRRIVPERQPFCLDLKVRTVMEKKPYASERLNDGGSECRMAPLNILTFLKCIETEHLMK